MSGFRISKTQRITRLTDTNLKDYKNFTQDVYPMWGGDGQIYFSSERSGHFNIWRIAATGGQPQQMTSHTDDGVQFPSMSPDGSTIAYENDFEVWTLKVGSRTPTKSHDRSRVRSEHQPHQFLANAEPDGRVRHHARRRLRGASTSTARSSSSRPTPTSAKSAR